MQIFPGTPTDHKAQTQTTTLHFRVSVCIFQSVSANGVVFPPNSKQRVFLVVVDGDDDGEDEENGKFTGKLHPVWLDLLCWCVYFPVGCTT